MKHRLFLSTSITANIDSETDGVESEFQNHVQEVLEALRSTVSFDVFCAIEYEGWVISKEPPEVSIKKDLDEIKKADLLLALVPSGASTGGVQFEIGAAYALGKKVFIATKPDVILGFFNRGASELGYIKHLEYSDAKSLIDQIKKEL